MSQAQSLAANQVVVRGRILEVHRRENCVATDVTLPAPDQWTAPQTVRVISNRLIGKPTEDITQLCTLRGYRRAYTAKNGEQGHACDVTLQAVE